ncbi:hypothetical protein G7Y89_g10260 [Cudoniella acicularis]|uniref:Uncharacterized protein n=1 Tax=Cudoniella acicularis TaxID=354080 RepID=A0A8H4RD47_9HELO|nr:hypothetical protein G7Y89_g10260 [Cudoniella acicularis]
MGDSARPCFDHNTLSKIKLDIQSPLVLDILGKRVKEERAALMTKASVIWPNDSVFRYIKEAVIEKGKLAIKHVNKLLDMTQDDYESKINDIENMSPK